jgi:hypothetical protein
MNRLATVWVSALSVMAVGLSLTASAQSAPVQTAPAKTGAAQAAPAQIAPVTSTPARSPQARSTAARSTAPRSAAAQATPPQTAIPKAEPAQAAASPIATGNPIAKAASSYGTFQEDITALDTGVIAKPGDLDAALDRMTGHSPQSLAQGWIAFSAIAASQSASFVATVREAEAAFGRDMLMRGFRNDNAYATRLKGAGDAVQGMLAAASRESARVYSVGAAFEKRSYDLQKTGWADLRAGNAAARVAQLKQVTAAGRPISNVVLAAFSPEASSAAASEGSRLAQSLAEALRLGPSPAQASGSAAPTGLRYRDDRKATVDRVVTLAAIQALDAAPGAPADVSTMLSDKPTQDCLEWARLHMYQCISAARFRYEHAFCLGTHALKDVGACMRGVVQ